MLILTLLGLGVLGSALGVVYVKYENRKLFVELQALQARKDQMDIEWSQLQLEQSTWATHGRIEEVARDRLGMVIAPADTVVIVRR